MVHPMLRMSGMRNRWKLVLYLAWWRKMMDGFSMSKIWNMEVLISLFAPEDVSLICSMRISRSFKVDSFCWVHTISGIYSVKTGYDEMYPLDNEQKLQACTQPSINGLLQQVWKVKTVPKIKHLMWQSLSNCLPVCSRLADRHCHQFGHVKDAGKTMRP
ncbi:hypothetical protein Rs2_09809 [Raphanus sativus]|nr:hypothetical protein Rs2_09809 [Raphanus sativus]